MARGWESKEVESQIETAAEERAKRPFGRRLTREEAARERDRETLESARDRVSAQLENPGLHPRHREMLEVALRDLELKLAAFPQASDLNS